MICTIGNTKGGVGKTTLAVNLAIALARQRQDVLLIDGDGQQQTAITFTQLRAEKHPGAPTYTGTSLQGAPIRVQGPRLAERYRHTIIDVGGRDSASLRAALMISDLVIVPAAPRSFEIWGVQDCRNLIAEARATRDFRALVILNCADPAGNDNQAALEALRDFEGLDVSPCVLVRRKAYPNAAAMGLGVMEHIDHNNREGSIKAREEFTQFFDSIFGERIHP